MNGGHLPRIALPHSAERPLARLVRGAAPREVGAAEHSRLFKWLVRLGFLARGVTYGLIGALALALALGAGTAGAKPDQQGALDLVARAPLGFVALIVIAVGLLAYAIWKISQAILGRGPEGGGGPNLSERVVNGGGGILYLLLCAVAVEILAGSGGAGGGTSGGAGGSPQGAAGGVLSWPAGPWLVGAAGVLLVGGAVYQAYYALSGRFTRQDKTEQMRREQLRRFRLMGKIGFMARAVVLALVGYFLVQSAIAYQPGKAVGVDGALARLHNQTLGPWLVGLVAVGLLIFGAFSLYEARFRRL
jgi:hypothetical protein